MNQLGRRLLSTASAFALSLVGFAAVTPTSSAWATGTADVFVGIQGPSLAFVGQTFNYELFWGTNGPDPATNVVITDALPAGLQYVSSEAPCSANNNVVTCSIATLWPMSVSDGTSVTVLATAPGTYTNTETIADDQTDPNLSNNSSSVTTTVSESSDLSVSLDGSPNPVVAGERETYTVSVTNHGPSPATGVTLTDSWSATAGIKGGIAFKSIRASQGTCTQSASAVSCDLGGLASGGSATITLVLQPRSKGTLADTASMSGNEPDPNTANNSASTTTTVS